MKQTQKVKGHQIMSSQSLKDSLEALRLVEEERGNLFHCLKLGNLAGEHF